VKLHPSGGCKTHTRHAPSLAPPFARPQTGYDLGREHVAWAAARRDEHALAVLRAAIRHVPAWQERADASLPGPDGLSRWLRGERPGAGFWAPALAATSGGGGAAPEVLRELSACAAEAGALWRLLFAAVAGDLPPPREHMSDDARGHALLQLAQRGPLPPDDHFERVVGIVSDMAARRSQQRQQQDQQQQQRQQQQQGQQQQGQQQQGQQQQGQQQQHQVGGQPQVDQAQQCYDSRGGGQLAAALAAVMRSTARARHLEVAKEWFLNTAQSLEAQLQAVSARLQELADGEAAPRTGASLGLSGGPGAEQGGGAARGGGSTASELVAEQLRLQGELSRELAGVAEAARLQQQEASAWRQLRRDAAAAAAAAGAAAACSAPLLLTAEQAAECVLAALATGRPDRAAAIAALAARCGVDWDRLSPCCVRRPGGAGQPFRLGRAARAILWSRWPVASVLWARQRGWLPYPYAARLTSLQLLLESEHGWGEGLAGSSTVVELSAPLPPATRLCVLAKSAVLWWAEQRRAGAGAAAASCGEAGDGPPEEAAAARGLLDAFCVLLQMPQQHTAAKAWVHEEQQRLRKRRAEAGLSYADCPFGDDEGGGGQDDGGGGTDGAANAGTGGFSRASGSASGSSSSSSSASSSGEPGADGPIDNTRRHPLCPHVCPAIDDMAGAFERLAASDAAEPADAAAGQQRGLRAAAAAAAEACTLPRGAPPHERAVALGGVAVALMRGAVIAVKVLGVPQLGPTTITFLTPREHFDVLLAAAAAGDDGALEAAVGVGLHCGSALFQAVARANALAAVAAASPGGLRRLPALLGPLIAGACREHGTPRGDFDARSALLSAIRGARPLTAAHEAAPVGDVVAAAVALLVAAQATDDPRAEEVLSRDWLQRATAEDEAARPLLAPPAHASLRAAAGVPGAAVVAQRVSALLHRMWGDWQASGGATPPPYGARRVPKAALQLVASGGSGGDPDLL
jgi:hypothetical protein